MRSAPDEPVESESDGTAVPFGRRVLVVLVVQAVTLVALYLFGRHFS